MRTSKFTNTDQFRVIQSVKRWLFLSSQVVGGQLLIQSVNAITGLLLIRYLPKEQYAWFTLGSSFLATLTLLSDAGTTTGLTALGGPIYNKHSAFARLLKDGLTVSYVLGAIGFILAGPFFYRLFQNLGSPIGSTIAMLGLGAAAVWPIAATQVLNVANRLHQRIKSIQVSELAAALIRTLSTMGILVCGTANAVVVMFVTVLATWVQYWGVKHGAKSFFKDIDKTTSHVRDLLNFNRSLYLTAVFCCLQGQVNTWLISIFGKSTDIADLGALSRLGLIFIVLASPLGYLVLPSVARIQDIHLLKRRILSAFLISVLLGGGIILASVALPNPFLWLLGDKYLHLHVELSLALSGQAFFMVSGLIWGMAQARGWIKYAWVNLITTLLAYATGVLIFPLNTVKGLLCYNIFSLIPTFLFAVYMIISNLRNQSLSMVKE